MAILTWDNIGERFYETGVDRGVLYIPDGNGAYTTGFAWNGLTNVTEQPSGAEASPQYADNLKYLNLYSAEEFAATIEAYTYPDEFAQFDGLGEPETGVFVGQQNRGQFGLSYRTRVGNDLNSDLGYKLHMIYGCTASPSEKAYNTINDSPEAITFSWEINTIPVAVTGYDPTSILTVDSTKVDAGALTTLENALWGTPGTEPNLPAPDLVIALFSGTTTQVTPTEPTYDDIDTITIPSITGVTYYDNTLGGVEVPAGAYVISQDTIIEARPDAGYYFPPVVDTDWYYNFP